MTAKASISVLQTRPGVAFRRLLMTRTTLWRKCDAFVQARGLGPFSELGCDLLFAVRFCLFSVLPWQGPLATAMSAIYHDQHRWSQTYRRG